MYPDLSFQCVDFDEVVEARPYAEAGRLGTIERGAVLLDQFLNEAGTISWDNCTESVFCEQGVAVSPDGVMVTVEHDWSGNDSWTVIAEAPEGLRAWTKFSMRWVESDTPGNASIVWVASWAGSVGEDWPADKDQVAGLWTEQVSSLSGASTKTVTEAWNDGDCRWLTSYRERTISGTPTPISWYIQVNEHIARVSTRGSTVRGRVDTGAWILLDSQTWEPKYTD